MHCLRKLAAIDSGCVRFHSYSSNKCSRQECLRSQAGAPRLRCKSIRVRLVLPNSFILSRSEFRRWLVAIVRPFNALHPSAEHAEQVAAVPYDVVNTQEARMLAAGNPLSFLHVSRPEIDLPDGTDLYSDAVYSKAQTNFEKLTKECPLISKETPSLYIYRLIMASHEQIAIAACFSIDEYDRDIVRKHERTRRDKEDDRTRHILVR